MPYPNNWKIGFWTIAWLALVPTTTRAEDRLVREFSRGSGQNTVGIVDGGVDTEIGGPQALSVDDDGSLFLLDQVNGRILRFDPRNPTADATELKLPSDIEPTDLVVRKQNIMVWDGVIRRMQVSGQDQPSYRSLEEVSTRSADDAFAKSAFAQMGSQQPGSETDILNFNTRSASISQKREPVRQYVASRGAGDVIADVISEDNQAVARLEITREGEGMPFARLRLGVRDRLGAVEFLEIDHTGRMFVFAENIPKAASRAAAFVARYSGTGVLEGVYELPLADVPLSRRFVTVSGDGDVYFLRTQRGSVNVLGVGFRKVDARATIDVRPAVSEPTKTESGPVAIVAMRPLTRQQTIETAFAFEGIQWKLTPAAYGRDPDTACTGFNGRVRRPTYLHGKVGQEVRGVPYCWGCHGSLDQIRAKIERGVLAGNICTHNAPRSDATGVDCSAFVSATWGLATHYTTAAIPAIASKLHDPWDLRPGDALNKPGSHVMLFLRFTRDRKAEVMEASPGACNGRVCRNIYPLASLLARGYQPVRFRALQQDTTVAVSIEPQEKVNKAQQKEDRPTSKGKRRPKR
jgi:hypothetical protein